MDYIYGDDLYHELDSTYRVYLCGDLEKPQNLDWIFDKKNEVGISYYRSFTADAPHFHKQAKEYNFVVSGCSKILLIDEKREFIFEEGSIFVIPAGTRYASKHQPNTKILFFKSPGGNDKTLVDADDSLRLWLGSWNEK